MFSSSSLRYQGVLMVKILLCGLLDLFGLYWASLRFLPFGASLRPSPRRSSPPAFPGNGGFFIWTYKAFGHFWGSIMGSWKFLTGVLNLTSYPFLCTDYFERC